MIRILLADDREEVREALECLLEGEPEVMVVGKAANAANLMTQLQSTTPDLILLDWELPGLDRSDPLQSLRRAAPRVTVIAMSGNPEASGESIAAGADAFISKGNPPEQVLAALHKHIAGKGHDSCLSPGY